MMQFLALIACFILNYVWFVNFEDDATEVELFRMCEMDLEVKKSEVRPILIKKLERVLKIETTLERASRTRRGIWKTLKFLFT